ncbi:MAG TPA: hypothetical protein VIR54_27325 [Vicinamibacterales bacterium]
MRRALVPVVALLAALPVTPKAQQLDACTVLSADEIKAALGRQSIGAAKASRAPNGFSDCTFPGSGAGDVRIMLEPPNKNASADFDLKPEILTEERKKFEKLTGVGDGAFYYEDRLEFRAGNRLGAIWVNRTPRTEAAPALKTSLTTLAKRIVERLR